MVYIVKKKNKYKAQRVKVDGINFHSRMEAKRYGQLKQLEKEGVIEDLTMQPSYILRANDVKLGKCILDFKYWDAEGYEWIIEDVKGCDNSLSKWKRKHIEAQYGIKVTIVTKV